jgi:hypothetical protein
LARQIEISLEKGKSAEHIVAFAINIIAGVIVFILGIFAFDWVKSLVTTLLE